MATHVDTAGRWDDFTATAHCTSCASFALNTDGDFERTVDAAEHAADDHFKSHADQDQLAFEIDENRFGPQDPDCSCAMSEGSQRRCPQHGEDAYLQP